MTTKDKLIKDMDDEVWNLFVMGCRLDGIKVNERLTDVLKEVIKKRAKR